MRSPRAGVIGGCEPSDMGARIRTLEQSVPLATKSFQPDIQFDMEVVIRGERTAGAWLGLISLGIVTKIGNTEQRWTFRNRKVEHLRYLS